LKATGLAVTNPKVASHEGDAIANSLNNTNYVRSMYNDQESYAIARSHTNGKKGE
jgi:hypothetical protein